MRRWTLILSTVVFLVALFALAIVTQASNVPGAMSQPDYQASYTVITPTLVTVAGIIPTPVACSAGGDKFLNGGDVILEFRNTNASARYITVTTPVTYSGMGLADLYVTVPATTGDVFVGPFPPKDFNSDGYVLVDYSAVADLTVIPLRVP